MSDLATEWDVGAPAQAGSDEQAQAFKAAFAGRMGGIGGSLQFTAAHAEAVKHEPLARRGARAERRVAQLAGLRLGQRHQLGHAVRGQRRVGDQHQRRTADHADRLEAPQRLVRQLRLQRRVDREGGVRADQQRVAVGLRLGHGARADHRAGPGLVVHDDGLPEARREALGHDAGHGVGGAAGRVRHDERHGLLGVAGGVGGSCGQSGGQAERLQPRPVCGERGSHRGLLLRGDGAGGRASAATRRASSAASARS